MSKKFREWNIEQEFLLPPSVKDFVPAGHISHFIRDLVVEELDLRVIMNDYTEERGYPPYDPVMMTALLLYSYTQGVYSSRRIARGCEERLDYKAVSGMSCPDFRTLAKFRKRHIEALGSLFLQVLHLCEAAKLVKLGHVALDGTRIKANAAQSKGKTYEAIKKDEKRLEEEVKRWFEEAEMMDQREDELYGETKRGDELPDWVTNKQERIKRLKQARQELEAKSETERKAREQAEREEQKPKSKTKKIEGPKENRRYNFTDSDSELMRSSQGFVQGYNAQVAVDEKDQVIVACHVSNARNDLDELTPAIRQIKVNIGRLPKELSADAGYLSDENLKVLKSKKIRGYIALGADPPERKKRIEPGSLVHQMSQRLKKGGKRSRYRLRKMVVEPVFGTIKAARAFRQFLLRGLPSTTAEWQMVCTAHNLLKLAHASG